MSKILVLENGDIHPVIETVMYISTDDKYVTTNGLTLDANDVLKEGDIIDEGEYKVTSIGTNAIEVLGSDKTLHSVPLENIEWCELCGDFHVYLDLDNDDVDEYVSGYRDAIKDCVEYLMDSSASVIRKTLQKLDANYLSELDTDEDVAEFVKKRFEKKKPQLTLDDLKKIVGYDFDLV